MDLLWVGNGETGWPVAGKELCSQSEARKEFGRGLPSSVSWVLVPEQVDSWP